MALDEGLFVWVKNELSLILKVKMAKKRKTERIKKKEPFIQAKDWVNLSFKIAGK